MQVFPRMSYNLKCIILNESIVYLIVYQVQEGEVLREVKYNIHDEDNVFLLQRVIP